MRRETTLHISEREAVEVGGGVKIWTGSKLYVVSSK